MEASVALRGRRHQMFGCFVGRIFRLMARTRRTLSQEEAIAVLAHLDEPVRTMAWLDAVTSLRGSELFGLQWADIDFEAATLRIRRAVVYGVVGAAKSEASRSRLPIAKPVLDSLSRWRSENHLCCTAKLGFRQSANKGQTAVLGQHAGRTPLADRGRRGRDLRAGRLAHVPGSISTWLIDNAHERIVNGLLAAGPSGKLLKLPNQL